MFDWLKVFTGTIERPSPSDIILKSNSTVVDWLKVFTGTIERPSPSGCIRSCVYFEIDAGTGVQNVHRSR